MKLLDELRQVIRENDKLPGSIKDEFLEYIDLMEVTLLAWSE